jgi:hypothetical protein
MSMIRETLAAYAALAFLGFSAVADDTPPAEEPAPATQDRDCFRTAQIRGWGVIDEDTLRVRINSRRQYALHLQIPAPRARFATSIGVNSRSGWVCTGREVGVDVNVGDSTARTWIVDHVERLPPPTEQTAEEIPAAQ